MMDIEWSDTLTPVTTAYSPTLRLRRLARELRKWRELAGLTTDDVEAALDWGTGKVSRLENRKLRWPRVGDIEKLAELYKIPDASAAEGLLNLARQARERGWWQRYKDVMANGGAYLDFETEASVISNWEPQIIPGLLQTRAYTAAVQRAGTVIDEDLIRRFVEGRMERQRNILDRDDPPHLWAVVDETALRRPVGTPDIMREQLHHLSACAARPNITVQIVSWATGSHAGLTGGGFVMLDFLEDPSITFLELPEENLFLEDPDDIQRYRLKLDTLKSQAKDPRESDALISDLAEQWKAA